MNFKGATLFIGDKKIGEVVSGEVSTYDNSKWPVYNGNHFKSISIPLGVLLRMKEAMESIEEVS